MQVSIPVQSRIPIQAIARLDKYWEDKDVNVRTMSQLVSWSMILLIKILEDNERIDNREMTIEEANKRLMKRGLYQPGMMKKTMTTLGAALLTEKMKIEGEETMISNSEEEYRKSREEIQREMHRMRMEIIENAKKVGSIVNSKIEPTEQNKEEER